MHACLSVGASPPAFFMLTYLSVHACVRECGPAFFYANLPPTASTSPEKKRANSSEAHASLLSLANEIGNFTIPCLQSKSQQGNSIPLQG
jgi:hypothetical protein